MLISFRGKCVDIARLGPIAAWRGTMGRSAPYRSIPITVPERHSASHGRAQKPIKGGVQGPGVLAHAGSWSLLTPGNIDFALYLHRRED